MQQKDGLNIQANCKLIYLTNTDIYLRLIKLYWTLKQKLKYVLLVLCLANNFLETLVDGKCKHSNKSYKMLINM
jgi:hypothetical protein